MSRRDIEVARTMLKEHCPQGQMIRLHATVDHHDRTARGRAFAAFADAWVGVVFLEQDILGGAENSTDEYRKWAEKEGLPTRPAKRLIMTTFDLRRCNVTILTGGVELEGERGSPYAVLGRLPERAMSMLRAAAETPPTGTDSVSALERLARLHNEGALTDDEFASAKARYL